MDHQVLRHKVAEMARGVESCHAMLEQIAYQFKAGVADEHLAGMIALTKVHATKTYDLCAREATQIMGGAACVRGGPGEKVERLYREVRINAIGGGSEEILMDRQCSTHSDRDSGRKQGWMRRANAQCGRSTGGCTPDDPCSPHFRSPLSRSLCFPHLRACLCSVAMRQAKL